MRLLPDIGFPQTGDKPEPGTYVCMQCNQNGFDNPECVIIAKDEKLPKCKNCDYTYWMKV